MTILASIISLCGVAEQHMQQYFSYICVFVMWSKIHPCQGQNVKVNAAMDHIRLYVGYLLLDT